MAWIRWRGRTSDMKWASIGWLDPRTGKERYKSARTADPVVAEHERRRVEREEEGREEAPARLTAAALVDAWLADLKRRGRATGTLDGYEAKMGRIVRELKARPLHTWTLSAVEDALLAGERKAQTVKADYTVLGTFLGWCERGRHAVPVGLRARLKAADKPEVRRTEREALPAEQVAAIIAAAHGTWVEPAVALAGWAGFGIGDIRALRRDEVRALDGKQPEVCRWQGRRKTGERLWVPLAPAVAEVLQRHRHTGVLVCRLKGKRATLDALARATAAAGVPRARGDGWHRLRHSYATRLGELGYDVATIRALMGHAPGSAVTYRYMHPVTPKMREAVGRVAAEPAAPPTRAASSGSRPAPR